MDKFWGCYNWTNKIVGAVKKILNYLLVLHNQTKEGVSMTCRKSYS